jgi:hypothetical protein
MLDPEKKPKEFLTVIVAAGLLMFKPGMYSVEESYKIAGHFVEETERRVGKLNP